MYSSRSSPPTLTPSAVIATALLSIFWKNAGPVGRYHISLLGLVQSVLLSKRPPLVSATLPLAPFVFPLLVEPLGLVFELVVLSSPVVAAGVVGPNTEVGPAG